MKEKTMFTTKKIVLAALLAALTVAGSALRITLPLSIAGTTSFHLGNIMCALSGILLGPWLGGLAAGLGSAIYDMMNPLYISQCWLTFLLKGMYGLAAGMVMYFGKKWNFRYGKYTIAAAAGAVSYAAVYFVKTYFYSGLFVNGLTPEAAAILVAGKIPSTVFNGVLAILLAPPLAIAIRKALEKSRLLLLE